MTENQMRYVQKPKHTWREPSPAERLEIIREQIKMNDTRPTNPMWSEIDLILRKREAALMAQIDAEREERNATSG